MPESLRNSRVFLQDFYGKALSGSHNFVETREFLRDSGILDETDPKRPSVIIPNYVNSAVNCVAESKFFKVCCINECEPLLGSLERHVAAPTALPSRIVELVEQLPSSTVDVPRKLSASLVKRLEDIAAHHGGVVPLHGRLFAQFMHHAFPRECPFPHLSGTYKPITQREWKAKTGEKTATADEAHMVQVIGQCTAPGADESTKKELPWSHEEELYIPQAQG